MALKIGDVNVIDNERNLNCGIGTFTSLDVPPSVISFSPADGATGVALNSNIVIIFGVTVSKGTGNITLRKGSASGTVIETIDITGGSVSVSGGAVTINPSDFPTGNDIYVVFPADGVTNPLLGSGNNEITTYNFTSAPISTSSFSPADGATNVAVESNIAITFSENIAKGTGNITLRAGSASGTVRQTIDVTNAAVSISGAVATINPPSNFQFEEDTYVVVDAGCFTNAAGDAASGNAIINTYNFTAEPDITLGMSLEGGYLVCMSSNTYYIVAPSSTEVSRVWGSRNDAITTANNNAACGDWFIPSCAQLRDPIYNCRQYMDSYDNNGADSYYWSNTSHPGVADGNYKYNICFEDGSAGSDNGNRSRRVRAMRTVSY